MARSEIVSRKLYNLLRLKTHPSQFVVGRLTFEEELTTLGGRQMMTLVTPIA